ncbi:MAG: hypothetical protein IJS78_02345 [Clostridia bacterium]|nr:hypothetical protein [Clostridia bacterium]
MDDSTVPREELKRGFKDPAAEFRPAPFWSWNARMEDGEVRRQVRDFIAHGFGGAFAHARKGLITEYLSDEFFDAFASALDESKKLGARLYMYDENCWPSGFAGGLVGDADEKGVITSLAKCRVVDGADPAFSGEVIFAAECGDGFVLGRDLTAVPREEWGRYAEKVMVIYRVGPMGDCGGHPYVDLTNRHATELFLKITYDEYFRRFGADFGGAIPAMFSDEANVSNTGRETVPFTPHVEKRFREISGFELRDCLPAVFRNVSFDGEYRLPAPAVKIRHDYYVTIHTLWIDNFVRPITDWCAAHGIAWTGHDVEHNWPHGHAGTFSTSEQHTYKYRQWPGLDLLLCDHLRDYPTECDKLQMIEVRSAANQYGKERTLCEAYGAGGYQSTTDDYKRMGDYLLVNGINLFVPHLSLYSYTGCRKRDCPQSFDDHQPWWNEWKTYNDYLARGSYILSRGEQRQRILYLNPSTTGYLVPAEEAKGGIDHGTSPDCVKNPDMSDFLTLFESMHREGWDFDFGDEYSMREDGSVADGTLAVGRARYDAVVVSKSMRNMFSSTARLLLDFMREGGTVISTGDAEDDAAEYIDGAEGNSATAELRSTWRKLGSPDGVLTALSELFEKRAVYTPATGVASAFRTLPDGRNIFFIVNHGMGEYRTDVTLRADRAERWDMVTGEMTGVGADSRGGYITFPLTLARCESALFVTGGDSPVPEEIPADREIPLSLVSITPERDNAFTLDHPSLEVRGKSFPPRYFIETCDNLFGEIVDSGNLWESMQRKTEYLDMNDGFGDDTAFSVTYRFNVSSDAVGLPIRAAYERPDVMRLFVNGVEVPYGGDKWLLGEGFGSSDITLHVRAGENELSLRADRFDTLCEIEAAFLEGDFSVGVEDGEFILTPGRTPGFGPWSEQGMSHYPGAVIYEFSFDCPSAPRRAILSAPDYRATAVSVAVNGSAPIVFGANGRRSLDVAKYLREGENRVSFRVSGSFQNLLGPHLNYTDYIPYDWSPFERGREAKADEYTFFGWGLGTPPTLRIG